jgi:gamma-glutamyltranspeptidase/glutathione hydrolase
MLHGRLLRVICVATVLTACGDLAIAQAPDPPPPIISGWARALPVLAKNGMVASQEARASRIGVEILEHGGNAVDAAVAVGFALAVTLPRAGNLGGGGFMLVHLAASKKTIAIDYRETAPLDTPLDVFLDEAGRFVPERSQSSGLGVGVPGTVAGLAHAHEKYGSGRFSLAQLWPRRSGWRTTALPLMTTSPIRCRRPLRGLAGIPQRARSFFARTASRCDAATGLCKLIWRRPCCK